MQKGIILSILFLSLLLFKNNTTLAQTEIEQKNLTLNDQKFYKNGALYTGFMIVKYETGQIKQKIEIKNGVPDGLFIQYHKFAFYSKEDDQFTRVLDSLENEKNKCQIKTDSLTRRFNELKTEFNNMVSSNFGTIENYRIAQKKSWNNELKGKENKKVLKIQKFENGWGLDKYWPNKIQASSDQCATISRLIEQIKSRQLQIQSKEFEYYQSNLIKNGVYKSYLLFNKNKEEGTFKNDKKNGLWTTYSENGYVSSKGNYIDDQKSGEWITYTNNQITSKGNYLNNKKQGEWLFYFDSGELQQQVTFESDLKSGTFKSFYKNGKVEASGTYKTILPSDKSKTEKKIGEWVYNNSAGLLLKKENYNQTGELLTKVEYQYNGNTLIEQITYNSNSLKNGDYKSYYENGKLKSEGKYSNNLQEGLWNYYYKNGKLKGAGSFLHGEGTDVGDTGIPRNNRDGNWKTYTESGSLSQTSEWKKNTCVGRTSYYANGNKQEEIILVKQLKQIIEGPLEGSYFETNQLMNQYLITSWNENSIKISEFHRIDNISDGKLHGPYREYDANGKLEKEFTYFFGVKNGEFKIYEGGILTMKGNICASCEDEDKLIGDLYIYENQKVKSHHYIEKNGTWYDRLNPNNPPVNPKEDLTERFKTSLPASFTVTQDGVSFLMRLDKNGTGMIMMGQYGPDNLLWSIKNGDQLSVYNTAFKAYTTYKITYSSKTTENPILEENSKGKVYYWNVKN
jgi:antitoxin component YwqK of YwqJK toxin-antitoxin module